MVIFRVKTPLLLPALTAAAGLMFAGQGASQTFTTLHSFTEVDGGSGTNTDGSYPYGGLVLSGNVLFGTTFNGGAGAVGTVFKINSDGLGFTNLHQFTAPAGPDGTNSDGGSPNGTLVLAGNTLYGTAAFGGTAGNGSVFRVNTDGTAFTNLHNFTAYTGGILTNTDGAAPVGGLVLSGNILYGIANGGGRFGNGSVFRLNADGTGFTNLHSFTALDSATNSDGAYPYGRLVLSGSTLYGVTDSGGSGGNGTIFKLVTNGSGFIAMHHFTPLAGPFNTNSDGAYPESGLALSGATLYGAAIGGGDSGNGTLFSINTDGTGFTNLHSFENVTEGGGPAGDLIVSGQTLYGTTQLGGGSDNGTVFRVETGGGGFAVLHDFTAVDGPSATNSDGVSPVAGLVLAGNILYGTASTGGASGNGTVFALSALPPPFTTLHGFALKEYDPGIGESTNGDGAGLNAGLVISGNTLFGAADSGGTGNTGTVFKLDTDGGGFTNLHSFALLSDPLLTNSDGAYPDGTLVLSGDTLYGTAYQGGISGNGTVFKIKTNGTGFALLHTFSAGSGTFPFNYTNSEGANPEAGMALSGNVLYGTTEHGGTSGLGVVFAIQTDGLGFTNLHSFTGGTNGDIPLALIVSGDTLYGAAVGFKSGTGLVYKMKTNGTAFIILHTFIATNFIPYTNNGPGATPIYANSEGVIPAGLTLSGNTLYGTAYGGGTSGNGAVFALTTEGLGFTNLHSFAATLTNVDGSYTNAEGAHPADLGGLFLSGHTLYGTTRYGGSSGNGTVFAVNTDGTGFTALHTFRAGAIDLSSGDYTNTDGANPFASVLLSSNFLYGTTDNGGPAGNGTVFSFALAPAQPQLTILPQGLSVLLRWPVDPAGFTLQTTTNLEVSTSWSNVSPGPVVVNGTNTVTNAVIGTRKYYRLIQ